MAGPEENGGLPTGKRDVAEKKRGPADPGPDLNQNCEISSDCVRRCIRDDPRHRHIVIDFDERGRRVFATRTVVLQAAGD